MQKKKTSNARPRRLLIRSISPLPLSHTHYFLYETPVRFLTKRKERAKCYNFIVPSVRENHRWFARDLINTIILRRR